MNYTISNGDGTNVKAGFTMYREAYLMAQTYANDRLQAWFVHEPDGTQTTVYPRGTKFAVIHEAGGEGKIVSRHKYRRTAETACQRRNQLANARVYAIKVVYP